MKLTKNTLKKIIREELAQEGIMDRFKKKPGAGPDNTVTVDQKIKDIISRFIEAENAITYDDGIIDEIHELGLTDETAEPGTLEGDMWAAISNYYSASTKMIEMLKRAADAYQGDYNVPRTQKR